MFYPPAIRKRIKPGANDPKIIPVGVVLHVACSKGKSLFSWFNGPSGGIESHLYIRRSGKVEQYRGLTHEADAQFRGNSWEADGKRYGFISVETAGLGVGRWNKKQLAAIEAFLAWASKEYGFPLRAVTEPQPQDAAHGGVGYHTQFPSWSNVAGKTCPGPRRKAQFRHVLRPWMREQRHPCLHCPRHCPKKETP